MKVEKVSSLFITAAFLVSIFSVYSFAWYGGSSHGTKREMRGKMMEKHLAQLDLSSEQKKKMDEHKVKHGNEMEVLVTKLKANRAELRQELDKEASDQKILDKITKETKDLTSQIIDLRLKGVLEKKSILTTEQYRKLSLLKDEGKKKHKGKMKKSKKGKKGKEMGRGK
ncbi:Spy/CpxP family protein refolding chaperone [Elusimicrobiota bacterium]